MTLATKNYHQKPQILVKSASSLPLITTKTRGGSKRRRFKWSSFIFVNHRLVAHSVMPWDSHIMLLVNSFSVFAYFPVPRKKRQRGTSKLLFLFWIFFVWKLKVVCGSRARKKGSIKLHKLHIYFHGILYFLNVSAFLYSRCRNYFTLAGPPSRGTQLHSRYAFSLLHSLRVFKFVVTVCKLCMWSYKYPKAILLHEKRSIKKNYENYVFSQHTRWKNSLDSALLSSMAFRRVKRK